MPEAIFIVDSIIIVEGDSHVVVGRIHTINDHWLRTTTQRHIDGRRYRNSHRNVSHLDVIAFGNGVISCNLLGFGCVVEIVYWEQTTISTHFKGTLRISHTQKHL